MEWYIGLEDCVDILCLDLTDVDIQDGEQIVHVADTKRWISVIDLFSYSCSLCLAKRSSKVWLLLRLLKLCRNKLFDQ